MGGYGWVSFASPGEAQGLSSRGKMDQDGYFLSPFDFLRQLFTFFRFKAAFKRFVLFLLCIFPSKKLSTGPFFGLPPLRGKNLSRGFPLNDALVRFFQRFHHRIGEFHLASSRSDLEPVACNTVIIRTSCHKEAIPLGQ